MLHNDVRESVESRVVLCLDALRDLGLLFYHCLLFPIRSGRDALVVHEGLGRGRRALLVLGVHPGPVLV